MKHTRLALYSLAHAAVDCACAAAVFSLNTDSLVLPILIYDVLAFSTQGLVGIAVDALGKKFAHILVQISMLTVACAFILSQAATGGFIYIAVALAGIGNSLFHTAAGAAVLVRSGEKARSLGIFVAPGALGLVLGTLYPTAAGVAAQLLLLALAILPEKIFSHDTVYISAPPRVNIGTSGKIALSSMLLFSIFARSYAGFAVSFPWKSGAAAVLILTAIVVAGKMAGGFVYDRFGGVSMSVLTVPAAALLLIFASGYIIPSLIGQFLVNLTMPLTLYLLYRLVPDHPGFIFGLAASFLLPGMMLSQLAESENARAISVAVAVVFAVNLVCLAVSSHMIAKRTSQRKEAPQ